MAAARAMTATPPASSPPPARTVPRRPRARVPRCLRASVPQFSLLLAVGLLAGCRSIGSGRVSAWVAHETRDVGPDTVAADTLPEFQNGQVRLLAARNETVAFQLVLHTDRPPAGPFDVIIDDLQGPGGTLAARSAIRLYRVHYTRVDRYRAWYPQRTGRSTTPRLVPDALVPWDAPRGGGPLRLTTRRNEIVWVDLHVPSDLAPGRYGGTLRVVAARGGREVLTRSIQLEVTDVRLPDAPALPVVCRVDPRDLLAIQLGWPRSSAPETRVVPGAPGDQAARELIDETMRLLHENRTNPVLWACFPKYRPLSRRELEIDWRDYDALVAPYLDGSAFDDGVGLTHWIIPASLEYPSAALNGGLGSPRYAALLANYLELCRRHFAERGWLERAILRPLPPQALDAAAVLATERVGAILQAAELDLPLMAHLPAGSLAPLGWHEAPAIDLSRVDLWCPPADWLDPSVIGQQINLGRRAWFVPAWPPYSGTLAPMAPAGDARVLPWQAFRYGLGGIWIEHATEPLERTAASAALIRSGRSLGYPGPVPTVRLKRLRRGIQDYDLLHLLAQAGRPLLARRAAEQIVRRAFTDACAENILDTRPTAWPADPAGYHLARLALLSELSQEYVSPTLQRDYWSLLAAHASRISAQVAGTRLIDPEHARVMVAVDNDTSSPVSGRWELPQPPEGWTLETAEPLTVAPGQRAYRTLPLTLAALTQNADGIQPFELVFEADRAGSFAARGRLAVVGCPPADKPITIDGDLSDWLIAAGNSAGDFRLVRGGSASADRPALGTQAFFCMDHERLYAAIRCALAPGEKPLWRPDNIVPVDGAVPWGQDVVELLIDPENAPAGTAANLYMIQIKPSGLPVTRRGCRTEPPLGPSEPWQPALRVAVDVTAEAWIIELSLPIRDLGPAAQHNRVWGLNITRLDARRGQYSSWSATRGYAYAPHRLGNLVLLRP